MVALVGRISDGVLAAGFLVALAGLLVVLFRPSLRSPDARVRRTTALAIVVIVLVGPVALVGLLALGFAARVVGPVVVLMTPLVGAGVAALFVAHRPPKDLPDDPQIRRWCEAFGVVPVGEAGTVLVPYLRHLQGRRRRAWVIVGIGVLTSVADVVARDGAASLPVSPYALVLVVGAMTLAWGDVAFVLSRERRVGVATLERRVPRTYIGAPAIALLIAGAASAPVVVGVALTVDGYGDSPSIAIAAAAIASLAPLLAALGWVGLARVAEAARPVGTTAVVRADDAVRRSSAVRLVVTVVALDLLLVSAVLATLAPTDARDFASGLFMVGQLFALAPVDDPWTMRFLGASRARDANPEPS